jgi:hypothetical protein
MTAKELAEAEAVCGKASPGPWIIDKTVKITDEDRNFIAEVRGVKISSPPAAIACKDDAAFIASARTLLPQAIEEIREAREIIKILIPMAEHSLPSPTGHVCGGPDSSCDMDCVGFSVGCENIGKARAYLESGTK